VAARPNLLANGGAIAYDDVRHSLAAGRAVIVLGGTGKTADRIASREEGSTGTAPASPLIDVVPDGATFAASLRRHLG
jgi:hypothetical protein